MTALAQNEAILTAALKFSSSLRSSMPSKLKREMESMTLWVLLADCETSTWRTR